MSTTSIRWSFTDNASSEDGFRVHDSGHTVKTSSPSHYHVYRDGVSGAGTLVFNSTGTSFDDIITNGHTYYIYSVNADDLNSASYINDNGFTSETNLPAASNLSPANAATGISINSNLSLALSDSGSGVDWSIFDIALSGNKGYSKHYTDLDTAIFIKTGTSASYNVTVNPHTDFATNELVTVTVTVSDLAGNAMSAPVWSFTTIILPSGAIAYWKLDEGSGQTVLDSIGSSNGTLGSTGGAEASDPTWTSPFKEHLLMSSKQQIINKL